MIINPFILMRKNPVEKMEILNNEKSRIIAYIKTIEEKENEKNHLKNEVIKELEYVVKRTFDNYILNLKRAIFNENENKICKILNKKKLPLNNYQLKKVNEYLRRKKEILKLQNEFFVLYQKLYIDYRKKLQSNAKRKNIQDYMLMIQPNMYYKLKSYITEDVEKHKSKTKKLDYTLYKVLARSTLKTSPFNNVTEIGRVQMSNEGWDNSINLKKKKIVNINHTCLYKIIFSFLYKSRNLIEKATYSLPLIEINNDKKTSFLVFKSTKNNDKIFENDEILKKVNIPDNIASLFRKKNANISYKDFLETFGDKYRSDNIIKIIQKFIEIGLLIPEIGISDNNNAKFISEIVLVAKKYLNEDENEDLQQLLDLIVYYKRLLENVSGIDERHCFYKELQSKLNKFSFFKELNINLHHLYYEDTYIDNPIYLKKEELVSEVQLYYLKLIQKFTLLFDTNVRLKLELGERLEKNKINSFSSDFYRLLLTTSKDISPYWLNPFYSIGSEGTSSILILLDELKLEFLDLLYKKIDTTNEKSVDIIDLTKEIISRIPSDLIKNTDFSSSFFIQKNKDLLIINNIYDGHEKYKARFMDFFESYLDKNIAYLNFMDEYYYKQNYYEYIENFGFNGNIKSLQLQNKILSNKVGKKRFSSYMNKYEELEKLNIKNTKNSGFSLEKNEKKIKIAFRGSLMPLSMPGYISTVLQLFSSGRMTFKFSRLLNNYEYIPRITIGNIVMSREKWKIIYHIKELLKKEEESEEEYFYRINKFFINAGLPLEFFVIAQRDMEEENSDIINFKPLFIDITNPIAIKVFYKEIINKYEEKELKKFFIEEYLSNDLNNVIEYDLEINKKEGEYF